jgi:uncharacterized integral membrane protein
MFVGALVLVVGLVFLMQNLGYISGNVWQVIWPLIVIVVGFSMIIRNKRPGRLFEKKKK